MGRIKLDGIDDMINDRKGEPKKLRDLMPPRKPTCEEIEAEGSCDKYEDCRPCPAFVEPHRGRRA